MKFEIKNWFSGSTIYQDEAESFSALVQAAVKAGANLSDANLSGAKDLPGLCVAQLSILPEGVFFGWKKCQNNVIIKLLIPHNVRRSNATGRKCRAESVRVLQVFGAFEGISQHDNKTIYRKGETVICDSWNENRWVECGGGIHFYLTRVEAENN